MSDIFSPFYIKNPIFIINAREALYLYHEMYLSYKIYQSQVLMHRMDCIQHRSLHLVQNGYVGTKGEIWRPTLNILNLGFNLRSSM